MNITFRQLKIFEAVARHASYTRAAEELYLTQPAVSIQVRSLEESLGVMLFEQVGKKIYLTNAGNEILAYSHGIAAQMDEIEDAVAQLKGVSKGRLNLAVATTANYAVTQLLAAFRRRYPDVTINLSVTDRDALLRMLAENRVDLVIMGEPPNDGNLWSEAFMDNPLVMIAPPDHRLIGRSRIPLKTVAAERFVLREEGSDTRAVLAGFARQHRTNIEPAVTMNSDEAVKQAVAAGLGLGVVSKHTLELELYAQRLTVLDVAHFPLMRRWHIVHRQGKQLSPTAAAFRTFMLDDTDKTKSPPAVVEAPQKIAAAQA